MKLVAKADSNGITKYYSFYSDRIIMASETQKQLSNSVVFENIRGNETVGIFRELTPLDTFVFSKSNKYLNSPEFAHLRKPLGAKGFVTEVYYYHGYPKNRKFQPL
jgi:hypothetical protein